MLLVPIGQKLWRHVWRKRKKGGPEAAKLKKVEFSMELLGLLFFRRLLRGRRVLLRRRRGCMRPPRHALLEAADALAQPTCKVGNFPPAEQEQDNPQDHQPMDRTKLAHESPPRPICRAPITTPPHGFPAR